MRLKFFFASGSGVLASFLSSPIHEAIFENVGSCFLVIFYKQKRPSVGSPLRDPIRFPP